MFFLLSLWVSLSGEFIADGEFYVCATPVFSITIDVRTLSFAFSGQTAETSMGQYQVTVTNTITTLTHQVLLFSTMAAAYTTGAAIEARNVNSNSKIDLIIKNTPGVNGTGGPETIKQGESIRTFTGGATATNEAHTIEVFSAAGTLTGKPAGHYTTLLYLSLSST